MRLNIDTWLQSLAGGFQWLVRDLSLITRQVEDVNSHDLTPNQLIVLKVVSLVAGAISVTAVLQASYWFIQMRRSFRHDGLIMLLMQSDMFKAIWFMIYPAVELSRGRVLSDSAFCQVSGFFLALGIEACDFAVLLIAVHTGLYVFCRGNGLYPYRRVAFAVFAGMPLILGSLAFINTPAFANSGEYCYLPMRPSWTRQSLSWIPRYIIFGIILLTYISIYVYIAVLLKRFGRSSTGRAVSGPSSGCRSEQRKRTTSVPPLPELQRHGIIPTPAPSGPESTNDNRRRTSAFSMFTGGGSQRPSDVSTSLLAGPRKLAQVVWWKIPDFGIRGSRPMISPEFPVSEELYLGPRRRASGASTRLVRSATRPGPSMKWKLPDFGLDAAHSFQQDDQGGEPEFDVMPPTGRRHTSPSPFQYESHGMGIGCINNSKESISPPSPSAHVSPLPESLQAEPCAPNQSTPESQHSSSDTVPTRPRNVWNRSLAGMSTRRSGSVSMFNMLAILRRGPKTSSTHESTSVFLSPTELDATGMLASRELIRRQARHLFIYPLVYLAVWLIPFVSHLLGEDRGKVRFSLILASLVSLCIQGAADALVFSFREKPWRHTRKDESGTQARFWSGETHDSQAHNVGRTRDEMHLDGRIARKRLNGEIEQRQSEKLEMAQTPTMNWWETDRVMMSMSPFEDSAV